MESKDATFSGEKEVLILAAAQQRFATYGYSKVTMDEIAKDCGMAKASLYYYFPNKESVFRSVIEREQKEFVARAATIFHEDKTAHEKLLNYVRLRLELAERLTNLDRLNQQSWRDVRPIFKELIRSFAQQEQSNISEILQQGKIGGEFQIEYPQKTASMILHALQGLRLRYFRATDSSLSKKSERDDLEHESLLFVDTLLHGILKNKQ